MDFAGRAGFIDGESPKFSTSSTSDSEGAGKTSDAAAGVGCGVLVSQLFPSPSKPGDLLLMKSLAFVSRVVGGAGSMEPGITGEASVRGQLELLVGYSIGQELVSGSL
jgi:hypothetical protein